MIKIAACTPSRGLVHSRTMESVRKNFDQLGDKVVWEHFFTHDKGIPDAQNDLIDRALEWGADFVWSVEEDNIIPTNGLRRMLRQMKPSEDIGVVCIDYPITAKRISGVCRKNGKILWCPMGCTLIASWVFEQMSKPYFSTDKTWKIVSQNPLELLEQDIPNKYGGHDIYFGMQCQKHDIIIDCIEGMVAGHIKPKESSLTHGQSNSEAKEFEIWDTIKQDQNYR